MANGLGQRSLSQGLPGADTRAEMMARTTLLPALQQKMPNDPQGVIRAATTIHQQYGGWIRALKAMTE